MLAGFLTIGGVVGLRYGIVAGFTSRLDGGRMRVGLPCSVLYCLSPVYLRCFSFSPWFSFWKKTYGELV